MTFGVEKRAKISQDLFEIFFDKNNFLYDIK